MLALFLLIHIICFVTGSYHNHLNAELQCFDRASIVTDIHSSHLHLPDVSGQKSSVSQQLRAVFVVDTASLQNPSNHIIPGLEKAFHDAFRYEFLTIKLSLENVTLVVQATRYPDFLSNDFVQLEYLGGRLHRTQLVADEKNCYYRSTHLPTSSSSPSVSPEEFVTWAVFDVCKGMLNGAFQTPTDMYHVIGILSEEGVLKHAITRQSDRYQITNSTFEVPGHCFPSHHSKRKRRELARLHSHQSSSDRSKRATENRSDNSTNPVAYSLKPWPLDRRTIDLYVIADHTLFLKYGVDTGPKIRQIVAIAASLYEELNIGLHLVGVEVWSEGDKIEIVGRDADQVYSDFAVYRARSVSVANDNAQLVTAGGSFKFVLGRASKSGVCTDRWSAGFSSYQGGSLRSVALTMTHEIGHNLGLNHDGDTCTCPDQACIMGESLTDSFIASHWSDCSKLRLHTMFDDYHVDFCLKNAPASPSSVLLCGNNVQDEGEECDCGPAGSCTNACCEPTTCRLHGNATCGSGECCDLTTCDYKPRSTLCRDTSDRGICDLPEFCSGNSHMCPNDLYKHDGTVCKTGIGSEMAYCFRGGCVSRFSQCRLLWGSGTLNARPICYTTQNILGTSYGHCGRDVRIISASKTEVLYSACASVDVMCGQLQCHSESGTAENDLQAYGAKYQLNYRRAMIWDQAHDEGTCQTTVLDMGSYRDAAMVPEGARCGDKRVCLKNKCVESDVAEDGGRLGECGGHGVMNQKGQCHCDDGWAPPDCTRWGQGGSQSSGPPALLSDSTVSLGLFMFIFAIIPTVCLLAVFFIIKVLQNRRNSCKYSETCLSSENVSSTSQQTRASVNNTANGTHISPYCRSQGHGVSGRAGSVDYRSYPLPLPTRDVDRHGELSIDYLGGFRGGATEINELSPPVRYMPSRPAPPPPITVPLSRHDVGSESVKPVDV